MVCISTLQSWFATACVYIWGNSALYGLWNTGVSAHHAVLTHRPDVNSNKSIKRPLCHSLNKILSKV